GHGDRPGGGGVDDRDGGAAGVAERRAAGGSAEGDSERFVALVQRVAEHGDGERLGGDVAVGPREGAAGGDIVAPGGRGAVAGRVADADGSARAARPGSGDRHRAGVLLHREGRGGQADRPGRGGVDDGHGGAADAPQGGAARRAAQPDGERLVALDQRVGEDPDRERLGGAVAVGPRERAGGGGVVGAGGRRAVRGGEGDADGAERRAAAHR